MNCFDVCWHVYVRVYAMESVSRLCELIKSSGCLRLGFGAQIHLRTRSQQLCLHRCLNCLLWQSNSSRTHTAAQAQRCAKPHTDTHSRHIFVEIGGRRNFCCLYQSPINSATKGRPPLFPKYLTVIAKYDTERCQLSFQVENWLKNTVS